MFKKISNQKGFIGQALMVLLLVVGVGVGTYLVQQRTNLLPKAYDPCEYAAGDPQDYRDCQRGIDQGVANSGLSREQYLAEDCRNNPGKKGCDQIIKNSSGGGSSFGSSTACDGQTLAGQKDPTPANFKARYGDDAAKQWVREHEEELRNNGTPCSSSGGRSSGASGGGSSKTKKDGSSAGSGASGGAGNGGGGSSEACTTDFTPTYFDAKVANRYARYKAIIAGIPEYCVQADLGAKEPGIREDSKDGVVKSGRLYLCSGKDSKKDGLVLVWRVISDDGANIRESNRENPGNSLEKVSAVMGDYIKAAETKLGIK